MDDFPEAVVPQPGHSAQTATPWSPDEISPIFSTSNRGVDVNWVHHGLERVEGSPLVPVASWSTGGERSRNTSMVPSESTRLSSVSVWNEDPFPKAQMSEESTVFQINIPWKDASVGLSSDCTSMYFFNEKSISITSLASVQTQSIKQRAPPLKHTFRDKIHLREVAASERFLAILTDQSVMLFEYDVGHDILKVQGSAPISWDPRGLALHQSQDQVLVLAGERRQGSDAREGRVKLYRYHLGSTSGRYFQELCVFPITVETSPRMADVPKLIGFSPDGKSFVCVTGIRNSVLVWSIEEDLSVIQRPLEISHKYTAETEAGGITSASLFNSPSRKPYVLSTSSPSSERARNGGEWSYISPVDPVLAPGPPPSRLIHRFMQLRDRQSLMAGAVPRQANVVALLEKTGKVLLIPLTPHYRGGLESFGGGETHPMELSDSLCTQANSSMGCIGFNPPGTLLYAVDTRGKLIRTSFNHVAPFVPLSAPTSSPEAVELPLKQVHEAPNQDSATSLLRRSSSASQPDFNRGSRVQRSLRTIFHPRTGWS